jgi:hypothetical protein
MVAALMMSASPIAASRSGRDGDVEAVVGEPLGEAVGVGAGSVPERDPADRADGGVRRHQHGGQGTGTDDQVMAGIGPRQIARGQGRRRGGAALGDRLAVHDRDRRACPGVKEQIEAVDGGQVQRLVARRDLDDLHAQMAVLLPGRHDQQRRIRLARARDGVVMPDWCCAPLGEAPPQCFDQRGEVECLIDGRTVENG